MSKEVKEGRDIAHHIFSGSISMIGVCIMVTTLFVVTNKNKGTHADEILGIDAFLFIVSSLISYLSLRRGNSRRLEWVADLLFFAGMFIMVVVGVMIVFTSF